MADTTFVARVTNIVTAWAQAVNNFIYRGQDPNFAVLTGGPTDYTFTFPAGSAVTTPTAGMKIRCQVNTPNTGPVTLTLMPMGITSDVRLPGGIPLVYDELGANLVTELLWSGSYWELMSSVKVPANNQAPLVRRTSTPLIDLRVSVSALTADRQWTAIDEDLTVVGTTNSQVISNKQFVSPRETAPTPANASGALVLDVNAGGMVTLTLTGNITSLAFSNVPATGNALAVTLILIQGGAGSYTFAWPGSVLWPGAVAPTLTTTVGKSDVITLLTLDGGASWRGFVAGQNY